MSKINLDSKDQVIENFLQDYLHYIVSEKGLGQNTYFEYKKDLEFFTEFCKVKSANIKIICDLNFLRKYLAFLRTRELSSRSIARKLSSLKQFFLFLFRENIISDNPAELLQFRVQDKKLPRYLSVQEMVRLLYCVAGKSEIEVRDRAMLELWYATGARVSELTSILYSNIDFKNKLVKLIGKGNRERILPISKQSIEWCCRYEKIRHNWVKTATCESPLFFITPYGKKITRQQAWQMVKNYARRAKISTAVWPHMIRHSFATHVLRNGANLRVVQELLGHRSIMTTEIYTHINKENLKLTHQKFHPRG